MVTHERGRRTSVSSYRSRGRWKTRRPGQHRQMAAFPFFFSFFSLFITAHSGVSEKEENSSRCCQALFTGGEGKGRRLSALQRPASGPRREETHCGFQRGALTHAAPVFIYPRTGAGAAGAAPSPRAPLCARGAVQRDPTGAAASPGPAQPARQLRGYN